MTIEPMSMGPVRARRSGSGLPWIVAASVGWAFASAGVHAQPVEKEVFTLDLTGRWYTADTVVDAMMEKAKSCWLSGDPAFAGFTVAGKRSEIENGEPIVWLDFKPVSAAGKARKSSNKASKKTAQDGADTDQRILRLFAVPTFSGGYGIGVEQRGIDIKPSMRRILLDLERRGVIAC